MLSLIDRYSDVRTNWLFVYGMKSIRYFQVGLLLHLISLLSLILLLRMLDPMVSAFEQDLFTITFCYGTLCSLGVSLFFFSQMDACSRFQDYKLAKDLLFENGFRTRVAKLFVGSRCQREALKVASIDLGVIKELKAFYHHKNYKWFHIIPQILFIHPLIIFSWVFWKKTLFVKPYKSKYFLW